MNFESDAIGKKAGLFADWLQLLRNFDLQIIYPAKPWQNTNYSLFIQEKMWMRVTEAETKDA